MAAGRFPVIGENVAAAFGAGRVAASIIPKYYKVCRTEARDSQLAWRPMRQSIADLNRRAEVSQQILDRYCSALAVIDDSTTLEELTATVERRVRWKGKSVRALYPFDQVTLKKLLPAAA